MINYAKVQWKAVNDYLLDIESAPTMGEFLSRAASGVDRLIPSDVAVGLSNDSGTVLYSKGFCGAENRAFNDYYRFRLPFIPYAQHFNEASLSLVGENHCAIAK
jgi:hypothetical protein